jgi:carboxypeptidase Q
MDNGGGAMISWTVLSLLRALDIRAKRTIRCILWTCGEFNHVGSAQYFIDHKDEMPYMSIAMESNNGVFHPLGLEFNGNNKSLEVRK